MLWLHVEMPVHEGVSDVGGRRSQQVPAHCKADCSWRALQHHLLTLLPTTPGEFPGSTTCIRGAQSVCPKGPGLLTPMDTELLKWQRHLLQPG